MKSSQSNPLNFKHLLIAFIGILMSYDVICQNNEIKPAKNNVIKVNVFDYGILYERILSPDKSILTGIIVNHESPTILDAQVNNLDKTYLWYERKPHTDYWRSDSKSYSVHFKFDYRNYFNENRIHKKWDFFIDMGFGIELINYFRNIIDYEGTITAKFAGTYKNPFSGKYFTAYDYTYKGIQTIQKHRINHFSLSPDLAYGFQYKPTKLPLIIESILSLRYNLYLDDKSPEFENRWVVDFVINVGFQF